METDIFLIIVIILIFLFLIYFVVVAIYSREVSQLKIPGVSESTFLFWVSVAMVAVSLLIIILLLWRLFSPPICKPKLVIQEAKTVKPSVKKAPRVYDTKNSTGIKETSVQKTVPVSSIKKTEPISTISTDSQLLEEERLSGL